MSFIENFLNSIAKDKVKKTPPNISPENISSETNSSTQVKQSPLIEALQSENAWTENGAVTHSTSSNPLVDLFFLAGASRGLPEGDIITLLEKSWAFDRGLTLRLIFWAGDVRGGAGERRFFRLALGWLQAHYPDYLIKNILAGNVEFYNRWDSLFTLVDNPEVKEAVLQHVVDGLEKQDRLLAKWLPRRDQYGKFKNLLQAKLSINDYQYRKLIVGLSHTVEQQMSAKEWSDIEYAKVPSQAFNKYRQAFLRNDTDRFKSFIALALENKAKINAGAIYPHQLYQAYNQSKDENSIVAQWNNLPNYMQNSTERILPICDVSGSMYGLPMDVSVALGIYISERNTGPFLNAFITFSSTPQLQYLQGSLTQRIRQLENSEWGASTDLQAVFRLLLNQAKQKRVDQDQMPTVLLIFSDMEFDEAVTGTTNLEAIRRSYARAGYVLPKIVFWNLAGRLGNVPAKSDDPNIALVSGFSPVILEDILAGHLDKFTPHNIVLQVLQKERYDRVQT
jgi:hypothetical protein